MSEYGKYLGKLREYESGVVAGLSGDSKAVFAHDIDFVVDTGQILGVYKSALFCNKRSSSKEMLDQISAHTRAELERYKSRAELYKCEAERRMLYISKMDAKNSRLDRM